MKKVNVDLIGVSKEVIVEYLKNNFYGDFKIEDEFNESGIWEIVIGSRGYIEYVEKNDEYKSFEDYYELDSCEDEEEKRDVLEYIEEFCDEGEGELDDGINCYEVVWGEEESSMFVKIV